MSGRGWMVTLSPWSKVALNVTPAVAPLHPWLWPTQPWQHIHIDYAGPIDGKMMLIVVDAHSKWPEVIEMSSTTSTTSQATIRALRSRFATFGLPQQVVSDNGPRPNSLLLSLLCSMG